jgi:hypothetical protein
MKRILFISVASVFLVLLGCSPAQYYSPADFTPVEDKAVVYVYRPWAFAGSGVGISVIVNETHVANLRVNNYIRLEISEGQYAFRIGVSYFYIDRNLFVESGQMYFLEVHPANVLTTRFNEAVPKIKNLKQVHTAF